MLEYRELRSELDMPRSTCVSVSQMAVLLKEFNPQLAESGLTKLIISPCKGNRKIQGAYLTS